MRTLVVNLWSGPGCSKSTTAASVFSKLKMSGINAELITEYAKQATWLSNHKTLKCQPYITTKQYYGQFMIDGEVDVMVTDSPLPLGCIYRSSRGCTPSFDQYILELFNEFRNLSFFLMRNPEIHPYNPKGRNQTEEEAILKDQEIYSFLQKMNIPFELIPVDHEQTADTIVRRVKENLICL